jgi:hypothetical protein
MRRTVTLDADVQRLLEAEARRRGISLSQALNDAVRKGLGGFVQRTFSMGTAQNFRWDKALATADAIEDEELLRKLYLGK